MSWRMFGQAALLIFIYWGCSLAVSEVLSWQSQREYRAEMARLKAADAVTTGKKERPIDVIRRDFAGQPDLLKQALDQYHDQGIDIENMAAD